MVEFEMNATEGRLPLMNMRQNGIEKQPQRVKINHRVGVTGLRKAPIEGFEDYMIVEGGIVYHMRFDVPPWGIVQCLTTRIDRAGYLTVRLSRDGETYTKLIHRLLAKNFIRNPMNLPEVDHIDGNKLNLALANLRWCTHAQNTQYAYSLGLNSAAKKIIDNLNGKIYLSIREAADAIGINYNTCCKRLERNDPNFPLRYLR